MSAREVWDVGTAERFPHLHANRLWVVAST